MKKYSINRNNTDGRLWGLSYLFAIGIPSIISAANASPISGKFADTHDYTSYEMRANRKAKRYFREFNIFLYN